MNPPPVPPAAGHADVVALPQNPVSGRPTIDEPRLLTASDLGAPRRLRLAPLLLFLATCFFTYAAGCYGWIPVFFGTDTTLAWNPKFTVELLTKNWQSGLIFMGGVMTVLICHEMGHFLMTVRYHVPASYPIFLPVPYMFTGTMGAVISMEGSRANRRQLFDIGLAGPLAGLIPTIPLVWYGIKTATFIPTPTGLGHPLFSDLLIQTIRPGLPVGFELVANPIYMAGWVGMFITGLNMMPVSQLDGGHTIYALFLKRGHYIARGFLLVAMAFVVFGGLYQWTLMLILITLIGVDHPPTSDDRVPLGLSRTVVGLVSLAIPVFCFTPYPMNIK